MSVKMTAGWIDAGSDDLPKYSGEDYRALWSLLFKPGPRPLTAAPGILTGLQASVTAGTVQVTPGAAIVTSPQLGSFVCVLTSQGRLPVSAAHSTYTRKDRVVVKVNPTGIGRGGMLDIVEGTPAAQPGLPAEPLHTLTLAELTVPARGAASISMVAPATGIAGGATQKDLPAGPATQSGTATYRGDDTAGTVALAVTTSGSGGALVDGLPEAVGGAGLLRQGGGEYWPVYAARGKVFLEETPPRGVSLTGTLTVAAP